MFGRQTTAPLSHAERIAVKNKARLEKLFQPGSQSARMEAALNELAARLREARTTGDLSPLRDPHAKSTMRKLGAWLLSHLQEDLTNVSAGSALDVQAEDAKAAAEAEAQRIHLEAERARELAGALEAARLRRLLRDYPERNEDPQLDPEEA
jgi:hypothetical protein